MGSGNPVLLWVLQVRVPAASAFDEGAHLTFRDVTVDSVEHPQVLRVRLKASKTGPFRVGINVFAGRTDKALCPVSCWHIWQLEDQAWCCSFSFKTADRSHSKVGNGGKGSYLSMGSGQLTVLGAQLPERCSNYSCQAGPTCTMGLWLLIFFRTEIVATVR